MICTMENHFSIERIKLLLLICMTKRTNQKRGWVKEQRQKYIFKLCNSLCMTFRKMQNCRDRKQISGFWRLLTSKGYVGTFLGWWKHFGSWESSGCMILWICQNSFNCILKRVTFILCKLYFNESDITKTF